VGGGGAAAAPAPAPNGGRIPGAPERVGCGPRRSPGRIGGRLVPGAACPAPCPGNGGRGRWKIGLPRSGSPVRGAVGVAPAGRTGAAYTGRGPVCGTIRRRCGTIGLPWAGGDGFAAGGAAGVTAAGETSSVPSVSACGGAITSTVGPSTSGSTTSGATSIGTGGCSSTTATDATATCSSLAVGARGGATAAGGATAGLGGITTAAGGRITDCGVIKRGAGLGGSTGAAGAALAAGATGLGTLLGGRDGTAAAGVTLVRGGAIGAAATGRGGIAGWAAFCVIAFSTSPGLEMCERSILGLNSSLAACEARLAGAGPNSPCSA